MASPEHNFISQEIGTTLARFSRLALYGITEGDRRKFDYSATLLRDSSRPLVAQVAWKNVQGIDKDIRTLLTSKSEIKLYVVQCDESYLRIIDEALHDHLSMDQNALAGFRLLQLPAGFDADRQEQRERFAMHLEKRLVNDLLLRVVFGHISKRDTMFLAGQGGMFGLRTAVLYHIYKEPYTSGPKFKNRIGVNSSATLDKALDVLAALGFIARKPLAKAYSITRKGRAYVDLLRRVFYELRQRSWSAELKQMLRYLGIDIDSEFRPELVEIPEVLIHFPLRILLLDARYALKFNADVTEGIDFAAPEFYGTFDWGAYSADYSDELPPGLDADEVFE